MNQGKAKTAEAVRLFNDYLTRTGRRHTAERVMVLEGAATLPGHFTIEQVAAAIDATGQHIASGTVYGTMQLLVDCGLLVRHSFGGRFLYEWGPVAHSHTVCNECGRVRDVRFPVLEQQARTLRPARFTPSAVAVTLYGTCSTCLRAKRLSSKKKTKPST